MRQWRDFGAVEEGADPRHGGKPSAAIFFVVVFVWSWGWWLAAGLTGVSVTQPPATLLFLVGGLGPVLAAVALVSRYYPAGARREFWRRIWDPRRVGWRRWLITIAAGAGPTVVGWLATSGGDLRIDVSTTAASEVGVAAWLVFAVGAALVEEPGWRGYALDALLQGRGPVAAGSLLGVAWAVWHLPQFFIEGTYQQAELGFGTGLFWMFVGAIVAQTFLYVWIVTITGGSILTAIVFHAATNLAGELLGPSPAGQLVALAIWTAAAATVVVHWRGKRPPV